jgi:hypothetical protein
VDAGPRTVLPELLDELAADDPRARRSRTDLRRIHVAMGTAAILQRALARFALATPPRRILELGAGDGTLMLRVAQRLAWRDVELTLLDRVELLDRPTRDAYTRLGWSVRTQERCVLDWAGAHATGPEGAGADEHYDLCVAALFLHHFDTDALAAILRAVADRARGFVAVEPRRGRLARVGSRLVVLLGANAVTRADAVTSVDAGFAGREVSSAWPSERRWHLAERAAGPFAHCFVATRGLHDGR